ncbi:helix-turn-helix domain-containing protein [Oceanobacillus longus]|uniref:Helix-turn-helix domain-containing protein n=1 Tax=Oceanobacillus longus TaxID=930120 RepID=A0ABV8H193_9BACI
MGYGIRLTENKHSGKNLVKSHHHQVHQILYVLENKGEITFKNQSYSFSQDSLAFITPYSDHSITSDAKMTILVLEFDLENLDSDIKNILVQQHFDETRLIELNPFEAGNVRQLLRRMLYEQSHAEPINLLALKIYLEELLLILLRTQENSTITNANVLRAERLREHINRHYFEISDANDISQKLGISTRHVNTIFKEQYDTTPMKYLNEVRMEMAKKLLMETDNDIASICFEVGFEAISTFYRRFKEYTHLSPNKYRMKYQYTDSNH